MNATQCGRRRRRQRLGGYSKLGKYCHTRSFDARAIDIWIPHLNEDVGNVPKTLMCASHRVSCFLSSDTHKCPSIQHRCAAVRTAELRWRSVLAATPACPDARVRRSLAAGATLVQSVIQSPRLYLKLSLRENFFIPRCLSFSKTVCSNVLARSAAYLSCVIDIGHAQASAAAAVDAARCSFDSNEFELG